MNEPAGANLGLSRTWPQSLEPAPTADAGELTIGRVRQRAFDRMFVAYARAGEHPLKQRILHLLLRLSRRRRIVAWCEPGWMSLDPTEYIQSKLLMSWAFEPKTRARVAAFLRTGDVFIDVGANIGIYSILAASRGAHVVAIEPHPQICAELMENLSLNSLERAVHVVSCAAGERPTSVPFGRAYPDNGGSSRQVPAQASALLVPVMPLAGILATLAVEEVRLIKIDVEGAELEVVQGLFGAGAGRPPDAIVLEYIPTHFSYARAGRSPITYLEQLGYAIETIDGAPYREGEVADEGNLWARRVGAG
jgi:FkbM family methyltransferase